MFPNVTADRALNPLFLSASVLSNPEKTPEVDFEGYKKQITNKAVVDQLQAAYKSVSVPYPPDNISGHVDDQEKRSVVEYQEFTKISNAKISEAEELVSRRPCAACQSPQKPVLTI